MSRARKLLVAGLLGLLSGMPAASRADGREWERHEIPGALCGNGDSYPVFISRVHSRKLAFYFEGGGVCWDFLTCFGPIPFAPLAPPDHPIDNGGLLSDNGAVSPLAGYTVVYFPYCTADIHLGSHTATYAFGSTVLHWGLRNVETALRHLTSTRKLEIGQAREIVSYGLSAGAIASAYHVNTLEPYLGAHQRKVMILDSPGLHWADSFWRKFPREMLEDFSRALAKMGLFLDPYDGNLAKHARSVCARFPEWQAGILQGSRDFVMSVIFGGLLPYQHERKVYGPDGIYQTTLDPSDNCAAWVPRSYEHVFMRTAGTARIEAGGKSAYEFVLDELEGRGGVNYRD